MKPQAVICDIDGTLADVSEIMHLAVSDAPDFDQFHTLASDAPVIRWMLDKLSDHLYTSILLVTARQEKYRSLTESWLAENRIPYDELWMRTDGDLRPDYDVKAELLAKILTEYHVTHSYDDNPDTVRLWLNNGIITTVLPHWPGGY